MMASAVAVNSKASNMPIDSVITGDNQSQTSQDSLGSAGSGASTISSSSTSQVTKRTKSRISNGHFISDEEKHEEELLRRRSASVLEVKEHAHARLREELLKAQEELKLKDEECRKLSHVQEQMGEELEDLTASLFEEANKMVQDANVKRMNQEKLLKEANSKVEVLEAEVTALKSLVITSTPSMPNKHLHPQLEPPPQQPKKTTGFIKGHRRSTSHHNISREVKLSELQKPMSMVNVSTLQQHPHSKQPDETERREVDPIYFEEFKHWKDNNPSLDLQHGFLARIVKEDIMPCLTFTNTQLAKSAFECMLKNTLTIDPVQERNPFPSKCALTETSRICKHMIKLGDNDTGHLISHLARNRITAVCDFFTYLRYISHGLVKSEEKDIYWEIMRLRKQVCLARLGIS